jgi:hypothetical protein
MKSFLLTAALLIFVQMLFAQTTKIDSILNEPEIKAPYYEMTESGSKVMYLQMSYGKSSFSATQSAFIKELKQADIRGIDLVYSDYPPKGDFKTLNKKRLESLREILPPAFSNTKITFRKIRQTQAATKEDASYLSHGFYIYYRPIPDKATAKKEIEKIKKSLGEEEHTKDSSDFKDYCFMERSYRFLRVHGSDKRLYTNHY